MKQHIQFLIALSFMVGLPVVGAPSTHLVKVTANQVNLRAAPSLQAEVVSQAAFGDILVARSFKQEWVEVAPDDSVDFWIHSAFIQQGEVTATELNIRAGAGINYTVVGKLSRGDRVEVRETFGEWLKIAPPYGSSLWVNTKLVELMDRSSDRKESTAETAQAQPARPRTVSPKDVEPIQRGSRPQASKEFSQPPPPPPQGMVLVPLEGQGNRVQKEGVLRRVGILFGKPADFRLVLSSTTHTETICYVRGNKSQLASFVGRKMIIKGPQYWVQGARYPVLIPEQIIPQSGP